MQLCGSLTQSVLHLKRCQASQPMGGVRASPLSRACASASWQSTTWGEGMREYRSTGISVTASEI